MHSSKRPLILFITLLTCVHGDLMTLASSTNQQKVMVYNIFFLYMGLNISIVINNTSDIWRNLST